LHKLFLLSQGKAATCCKASALGFPKSLNNHFLHTKFTHALPHLPSPLGIRSGNSRANQEALNRVKGKLTHVHDTQKEEASP
jgi:hypothetical protein